MMFRKRPSTEKTWEFIRAELKRLRGNNLLRAREEQFPARNELILYDEPAVTPNPGCWILSITASPEDVSARHAPSGEILKVDSDLPELMEKLALRLRGKPYLRTKAKGTEYR